MYKNASLKESASSKDRHYCLIFNSQELLANKYMLFFMHVLRLFMKYMYVKKHGLVCVYGNSF